MHTTRENGAPVPPTSPCGDCAAGERLRKRFLPLAVGLPRRLLRSLCRRGICRCSILRRLALGLRQFVSQEPNQQNQHPRDHNPIHVHSFIPFQRALPDCTAPRRRIRRRTRSISSPFYHLLRPRTAGTARFFIFALADMTYNVKRKAWKSHPGGHTLGTPRRRGTDALWPLYVDAAARRPLHRPV